MQEGNTDIRDADADSGTRYATQAAVNEWSTRDGADTRKEAEQTSNTQCEDTHDRERRDDSLLCTQSVAPTCG